MLKPLIITWCLDFGVIASRAKMTTKSFLCLFITTVCLSGIESQPQEGFPQKRKSQQFCDEYSKNVVSIIINATGQEAYPGEFPHMSVLGFYNKKQEEYRFSCGGTLISDRYVVTAAHCLNTDPHEELKIVRLGAISVPGVIGKRDPAIDHNVTNVTIHEDYNEMRRIHDIALIKLEKKVVFSDTVRPACLYTKNDDPNMLVESDWTQDGLDPIIKENKLVKILYHSVPLQECIEFYKDFTVSYVTDNPYQLCARLSGENVCGRYSGGPLQIQNYPALSTVVGVLSYQTYCTSSDFEGNRIWFPVVYTKISSYLDWIEKIVWP